MGDNTGIAFCDATWNVLLGCSEASEGCRYCWARRDIWRLAHNPRLREEAFYDGVVRKEDGHLQWTGTMTYIDARLTQPLTWRKPRRIFVASHADLFHENLPLDFAWGCFRVMLSATHHRYLVLTKRPEQMRAFVHWMNERGLLRVTNRQVPEWIWLGVTAENQRRADERIPILLDIPAVRRWVSLEPLLGAVDVSKWISREWDCGAGQFRGLDWVVAAGESGGSLERALVERCSHWTGPCSRCDDSGWAQKPESLGWVRGIRDQCEAANVPLFFKGWGGPRAGSGGHLLDGQEYRELPAVLCLREAAGLV